MRARCVVIGAAVLLAGLTLSACGGGSDRNSAAPGDPNAPVQATPGASTTAHYAVTGTVRDSSGHPVVGVLVVATSLAGQDVPELAVLTDAHGHYRWPSLQAGRYELLVRTHAGRASGRVTVTPPGPASLDLTLNHS